MDPGLRRGDENRGGSKCPGNPDVRNNTGSTEPGVDTSINGDIGVRAFADTSRMPWTPSPSASVWRKRVHRVGPPEAGQVTSIVRYEPDSSFHLHDHPDGEEILVLDGTFSDEHGDWPAGTYLLNPEGFRHAPFSREGCLLFVKLRQFPGKDREHVVVDTGSLAWRPTAIPGVSAKPLYRQAGYADTARLERWDAHTDLGAVTRERGCELLVLDGELSDDTGTFGKHCWMRLPAGFVQHPRTTDGCTLYVKEGGLSYLRSDTQTSTDTSA